MATQTLILWILVAFYKFIHRKTKALMDIKTVILWILVALYVVPSLYFGYLKLAAKMDVIEKFKKWGYPIWFMRGLGLAEMVMALLLIFPTARPFAIAIFAIILVGAIYTNVVNNEPRSETMTAIMVFFHLIIISILTFWIK